MKIGFIGCGNMGSAMIGGILKKGVFAKDEIIVSNLTEEGSKRSREKLGVVTTMDNCEVVKNANIVILAVKPQFYEEVISQIQGLPDTGSHDRRNCPRQNSCMAGRKMRAASESGTPDAQYPGTSRRRHDRRLRQ